MGTGWRRAAAVAAAAAAAEAAVTEKKKHTARNAFWFFALIAGIGAAVAAWTRTRSTEDPWAEPWEPATDSGHSTETLRARAHEAREDLTVKVGDAAETVGEVAGVTVAKSREATRKAADKVTAAAEELTEKVSEAREDLTEKVADAAKKVTTRRSVPKSIDTAESDAVEASDIAPESPDETF